MRPVKLRTACNAAPIDGSTLHVRPVHNAQSKHFESNSDDPLVSDDTSDDAGDSEPTGAAPWAAVPLPGTGDAERLSQTLSHCEM